MRVCARALVPSHVLHTARQIAGLRLNDALWTPYRISLASVEASFALMDSEKLAVEIRDADILVILALPGAHC